MNKILIIMYALISWFVGYELSFLMRWDVHINIPEPLINLHRFCTFQNSFLIIEAFSIFFTVFSLYKIYIMTNILSKREII